LGRVSPHKGFAVFNFLLMVGTGGDTTFPKTSNLIDTRDTRVGLLILGRFCLMDFG
jgi:hypothetical protein